MQVGSVVENVLPVRANPVVNERCGWKPIPHKHIGIVTAVRPTNYGRAPEDRTVYVDVDLLYNGELIRLGNYAAGYFREIW